MACQYPEILLYSIRLSFDFMWSTENAGICLSEQPVMSGSSSIIRFNPISNRNNILFVVLIDVIFVLSISWVKAVSDLIQITK